MHAPFRFGPRTKCCIVSVFPVVTCRHGSRSFDECRIYGSCAAVLAITGDSRAPALIIRAPFPRNLFGGIDV